MPLSKSQPTSRMGAAMLLLRQNVFSKNPVLLRGLALTPVLFVSTTLKAGLLYAACAVVALTVGGAAGGLLSGRVPAWLRASLITLITAAAVTPICMFASWFAPNVAAAVSFFLPLLAVNSILLARDAQAQQRAGVLGSTLDAFTQSIGFGFALVLLSAIREIIGYGELYERAMPGLSHFSFSFILTPAGGLATLACIIAVAQFIARRRKMRRAKPAPDANGGKSA